MVSSRYARVGLSLSIIPPLDMKCLSREGSRVALDFLSILLSCLVFGFQYVR